MNVFIVTEAGTKIGYGHLTRCSALYQAFRRKNITPTFIVNGDASVQRALAGKKFVLKDWFRDLDWLRAQITGADILIVDSYLADRSVYKMLSVLVKLAVYIDDNKRLNYPAGIVLNANVYGARLKYTKRRGVEYLLGPEFALLREEFRQVPQKKISRKIKYVLVTFGGSDFLDLTPRVIKILQEGDPALVQCVVVGRSFTDLRGIRKLKSRNVRIFENSSAVQMIRLMLRADVAISAAGQTLMELARVGVPTIGVCAADNQKRHLQRWRELGFYGIFDPEREDHFGKALRRGIKGFLPYARRLRLSRAVRTAVNSYGPDNVVKTLLKKIR